MIVIPSSVPIVGVLY